MLRADDEFPSTVSVVVDDGGFDDDEGRIRVEVEELEVLVGVTIRSYMFSLSSWT